MSLNSLVVNKHLPQHIAEDYPKFVEFIQVYYDFLEQYKISLPEQKDVDLVSDPLYDFLKRELAYRFPSSYIDKKKFLRTVRELYKAKGTFAGIELLFRLFFNESIKITRPSKQILRTSDGKWIQNNFFTIELDNPGADFSGSFIFKVTNSFGVFSIEVEKTERISDVTLRIHYAGFKYLKLAVGDSVEVYNKNNVLIGSGKVIRTPSKLKIIDGGKNWFEGQVFKIPASNKDSNVRVTRVDAQGAILGLEIFEYGYNHAPNQIISVSPYPTKPVSNTFDYTKTLTAITPEYTYHHELVLRDYVEKISEDILGLSIAKTAQSYFLEDYVENSYSAIIVITASNSQTFSISSPLIDPDLTLEEWLESQAYIYFEEDVIVKNKGYFQDESGQLSNQEIRLQDNYFYQLFSYLIESEQSIEQYRNILELIHPAGLKYFANLSKTTDIVFDEDLEVYRTLSSDKVFLLDILNPDDFLVKDIGLNKQDSIDSDAFVVRKDFIKSLADSTTNSETLAKSLAKTLIETTNTSEAIARQVSKAIEIPLSTPTDSIQTKQVTKTLVETTTNSETISLGLNKYNVDNVNINDGSGTTSLQVISYNVENYFSEDYVAEDFILTVG